MITVAPQMGESPYNERIVTLSRFGADTYDIHGGWDNAKEWLHLIDW